MKRKGFMKAMAFAMALITILSNPTFSYADDINGGEETVEIESISVSEEEPEPSNEAEDSLTQSKDTEGTEVKGDNTGVPEEKTEPEEGTEAAEETGKSVEETAKELAGESAVELLEEPAVEETQDDFSGVRAIYGSPLVDGTIEDVWENAYEITFPQARNNPDSDATAKVMWDDNALYVLVEVTDSELDKKSGNAYEHDSVEVFLDELNQKAGSYDDDDVHYRVNFDNERSTDSGDESRWYTKTSKSDTGYIVEGCIKWSNVTPENDVKVGFDLQINCASNGTRVGECSVFATSGDGYQNTALFGEARLEGKDDTDVTPGFPYSLMTVIENAKKYDVNAFKNGDTLTEAIKEADALLEKGNYTQEELDAAAQNILATIDKLDDGSGYTSPKELVANPELPDIFTFFDGETKVTKENWEVRKKEIKEYYDYYMYGPYPDTSCEEVSYEVTGMEERTVNVKDPVTGEKKDITVKQGTLNITVKNTETGDEGTVGMVFVLPTTEAPEGGYPFYSEMSGYAGDTVYYAASRGMACASWTYTDFASDDLSRGGLFYKIHPYGTDWKHQTGALVAWGWGAGKILDALEKGLAREYNINAENNMLAGVSRLGKATAVAGAYDERIKYVDPTCSGAGGMACFRYSSVDKTYDGANIGKLDSDGNTKITIDQNEPLSSLQASGEIFWFNDNFAKLSSLEQLPFDQYYLASLMADEDRYLMITAGFTGENWTNSASMSLTYLKARELYRMLGLDEHIYINVHETNEGGSTPNHKVIPMDLAYFIDLMYENEYGVKREDLTTDRRNIKTCVFFEDVNWDSSWDSLVGNNLTAVASEKYVKKVTALDYGASLENIAVALPKTVSIYVDDARYMEADVNWDVNSCGFDSETLDAQELTVKGTLSLPEGVINDLGLDLTVSASVNISAKPDDIKLTLNGADESEWADAGVYEAKKTLKGETDTEATISLMHDDKNLYVKAVVKDDDVVTKDSFNNDADYITLTIAPDKKAGANVKNLIIFNNGVVSPSYSVDLDWSTYAAYLKTDYVKVNAKENWVSTEDGYEVTVEIPFAEIGKIGNSIAFEAVVSDIDAAGFAGSKALFVSQYPGHEAVASYMGFWNVNYDAGLYAEDLHAASLAPVAGYKVIVAGGFNNEAWGNGLSYTIKNVIDGKETEDGNADVKLAWDDAYLYIAANVTDSNVVVKDGFHGSEEYIELNITADDGTVKKVIISADGTMASYTWSGDLSMSTFAGYAFKTYNNFDGGYAASELTDKGWKTEAALKWEDLGIKAENGKEIALDLFVNECNESGAESTKALFATENAVHTKEVSGNWWGFLPWSASYNDGFAKEDLTNVTFTGKDAAMADEEDIGRYDLLNMIATFEATYVDIYPIKDSFDEAVLLAAKNVALNPAATKEEIAEQKQILEDMAYAVGKDNYFGRLVAMRGTPLVDGNPDDPVWENNTFCYETTVDEKGQGAEIKALWDDEAVYYLVTVKDPTFDVTGSDAHQKDSVEFFFIPPEDAAKNSFGRDGGQWRINRANVTTVTFGDNEPFYAKLTEIEGGYVVEARYEFAESMNIKADSVLNTDINVNLCEGGTRTAPVFWFSGDCYNNPNMSGEMQFIADEAGESSVASGYNPYALLKVLDKALVMDVVNYDEESFNANYDFDLLNSYYEEVLAGKLDETTIKKYYENVIAMMSKITYDGVHKSVLGFEENADYPDAFTMNDDSLVDSEEDWKLRHEEIQDLYEFYMYGKLPKAEETGLVKEFSGNGDNFTVTVSRPGIDPASFSFKVDFPEGEAPEGGWPYIINYGGNIDGAQAAGYAVVEYSANGDVASNDSYYNGVFYKMYPDMRGDDYTKGVGPLAARAWGAGLIIDCIESGIGKLSTLNPENSAVTGFSYLGKTALVTGVLEDRIKVVNPAHSGIGGAAPFRYSAQGNFYDVENFGVERDHLVTRIEPIGQVQGQGMAWVKTIFADFLGGDCTPFDTYMLLSLVAPRGLFVSAGYYDNGTNPEGMYAAYVQARKVFEFLGAEDKIAFGDYATDHATSTPEWNDLFTFCDYIFYGKELSEEFYQTVFDNSSDRTMYDVIKLPKDRGTNVTPVYNDDDDDDDESEPAAVTPEVTVPTATTPAVARPGRIISRIAESIEEVLTDTEEETTQEVVATETTSEEIAAVEEVIEEASEETVDVAEEEAPLAADIDAAKNANALPWIIGAVLLLAIAFATLKVLKMKKTE